MQNPVLISESFERAASNLSHAMERFGSSSSFSYDVERFERSIEQFRASVDKLAAVLDMQAESDQRKALGHTESDFTSA